jgi:hypothetical protein
MPKMIRKKPIYSPFGDEIIAEPEIRVEEQEPEISVEETVTQFGFLIKDLNQIDIAGQYEILKKNFKLGKDRLDPDILSEAIDAAPEWSFKAAQLYILAKDKFSKFEDLTFKIRYAEFSEKAAATLEQKRKNKDLSGAITKEKIENWILINEPKYKKLLQEKRELEAAVEIFKSLSAQFESKKSLLQTQGRLSERKKFSITQLNT